MVGVKSSYKEKKYSPENETCVHSRSLFLPYLFWIKLCSRFYKLSTFKTRPFTLILALMVNRGLDLNKSIRSKLVSTVFLLFGNIREIRSPNDAWNDIWKPDCLNSQSFLGMFQKFDWLKQPRIPWKLVLQKS